MTAFVEASHGEPVLSRLLHEQTFDVRHLDPSGFRAWLDRHWTVWQRNEVFLQQSTIRDLRRKHPRLTLLERAHRTALAADAATAQARRLEQLVRAQTATEKALAGLGEALATASPALRTGLEEKLTRFTALRSTLREEYDRLLRDSPARRELLDAAESLRQFRQATGLDDAEARLARLFRAQGHRRTTGGQVFEQQALALTRQQLPAVWPVGTSLLTSVKFGASRIEFDQLLVQPGVAPREPVTVLAAIEVKRNLNDLAHGFRRRQENLTWLTGDVAGLDPATYRSRAFPTGRFDRPAIHHEDGRDWIFTPASFQLFRRDPQSDWFLDRLHFISRQQPLWGLGAAALGQIRFRAATDRQWAPDDVAYLERLRRWCQSLAQPVETPDVLAVYAQLPALAHQILFISGN